jgi:hypothetical protein
MYVHLAVQQLQEATSIVPRPQAVYNDQNNGVISSLTVNPGIMQYALNYNFRVLRRGTFSSLQRKALEEGNGGSNVLFFQCVIAVHPLA